MGTAKDTLGRGPLSWKDTMTFSKPQGHRQKRHILRACTNHANHADFIPAKHLSPTNFPVGLQSEEILEITRQLAHLVVRVRVVDTSPACTDGDGRPSASARTCTGVVTSVGNDYVAVRLPSHAVRNDSEASKATAEFFYDDDESSDVITARGLSLTRDDLSHTSQLTCRACPELEKRLGFNSFLQRKLSTEKSVGIESVDDAEEYVAVLISHPHGFSKRVSVGSFCGVDVRRRLERDLNTMTNSWSTSSGLTSMLEISGEIVSSSSLLSASSSPFSASSSPFSASSSSFSSSKDRTRTSFSRFTDRNSKVQVTEIDNASVAKSILTEHEEPASALSKLLSKITSWSVVTPVHDLCEKVISWGGTLIKSLFSAVQRLVGLTHSASHDSMRVYHDATSCQGSSGGAVLLIGRRTWGEVGTSVTSLPVFLHVGKVSDTGLGVAVALEAWDKDCRSC